MQDRTVVFSRAVWKFWGSRQMVIPDLATSAEKFVAAVERGNAVCRKYFPYYTLYCVGIKLRDDHKPHYELSCIPPDAEGWAYGCEFEPMMDRVYSRDHLQSFKNAIYDIGVDIGASYYRFGGMMKGYIRRALGDDVVDRRAPRLDEGGNLRSFLARALPDIGREHRRVDIHAGRQFRVHQCACHRHRRVLIRKRRIDEAELVACFQTGHARS